MDDQAQIIAAALRDLLGQERARVGEAVDSDQWRSLLIDAATIKMARRRGLSALGWAPDCEDDHPVVRALERWPQTIWDDPHTLGWLHEQYAATARNHSFADHVHREAKHSSATVATQLYTPRWIADFLARSTLEIAARHAPGEPTTVCDPAVGGGQMLLAALSVLAADSPNAPAAAWAEPLWGFDLDDRAVEVARRTLALEIGRLSGARDGDAEACLARQLSSADSLVDPIVGLGPWTTVLTNPPYMGRRSMPAHLKALLDDHYRPYHLDLFAAFIARCHDLATASVGILAQQSIWYLKRFRRAREDLLDRGALTHFLHLGAGAFWNLDGEKASVVAFVQAKNQRPTIEVSQEVGGQDRPHCQVWDLRSYRAPGGQRDAFRSTQPRAFDLSTLDAIPGRPICHDLHPDLRALFQTLPALETVADIPGGQNKTGRNRQYVRRWSDVDAAAIRRADDLCPTGAPDGRWVFYSKGGRFAPWWGNWEWVVDWSEQARAFYQENRNSSLLAEEYWFRPGIVYTDFGGKRFNARYMPAGCVFDMTGPAIFPGPQWWPQLTEKERLAAALAVLNSSPARRMLRALNPTLHFQVRDVRALPVPALDVADARKISALVWRLIDEIQRWHGELCDDPLANHTSLRCCPVDELESLETDIDQRICDAYGVKREPVQDASVARHHRLAQLARL